MNRDKAKWKCKSRFIMTGGCKYECIVETDFEPRGCLRAAIWQDWEEIKEDKVKGEAEKT